ncbi:MAG: hypothetical protein FWD71_19565, partial [Oscillospiraceae bacterium]|nr:hypothetical protein [Oscillospiraceae bacterium]
VDDDIVICDITYDQRLKEGKRLTMSRLKRLHKDNPIELSDATDEFYHALTVHSDVYFEAGMKVGARLLFQLLCQGDCAYDLQPK